MYIVFDVGATKVRVATSENLEELKDVEVVESAASLEEIAEKIEELTEKLASDEPIEAIAGGITAAIDNTKGQRVAEILRQRLKISVYADNDAAVVGLGEAHFGAGKDFSIVQYMTISTGIGGARIIDRKIDKSSQGFEPGHQIIRSNDEKENRETLQNLASGHGISQKFQKAPKEILDEKVWNDLAYTLSIGVYNSMLHWSPEVIVLGGPMIVGDPAIPIEKIKEHVEKLTNVFPKAPIIKKSELKDYGGLYGGLVLIKQSKE